MNKNKAIKVLEALASGCSPSTGEVADNDSILNEREVIRALQLAIDELKKETAIVNTPSNQEKEEKKKKESWKEITFFQQETFNNFTEAQLNQLKEEVNKLGLFESEDLPQYIVDARVNNPRAYEKWTKEENELLMEAIKQTNDLSLLSQCFQRSADSIESSGQKLLYKEQKPPKKAK